ncbi:hypothetical protein HYPSUDRAFT_44643 [Hypholoma sublateritium FD-334 SS-4]|uniref:Uncharacterized protein n=1 Tax=Hypholoma sublateritium (strain FD-334 SS-4) TaxID=945553 RepID=A0A0D2KWD4_HYPSF|nr:hypothetical protein HYPSUDRAFT_44643 [Hypholoma sublateritium FD-334 SS-4]
MPSKPNLPIPSTSVIQVAYAASNPIHPPNLPNSAFWGSQDTGIRICGQIVR